MTWPHGDCVFPKYKVTDMALFVALTVAAQGSGVNAPRYTMFMRCLRLAGRLREARKPRGLTFIVQHNRIDREISPLFFDELNLTVSNITVPIAFMPSMDREELGGFLGCPSPP